MRNLVNSLNKSFTGSVLLWVTDLLLPLCSTPPRPLLSPPGLWAPASGHPQPPSSHIDVLFTPTGSDTLPSSPVDALLQPSRDALLSTVAPLASTWPLPWSDTFFTPWGSSLPYWAPPYMDILLILTRLPSSLDILVSVLELWHWGCLSACMSEAWLILSLSDCSALETLSFLPWAPKPCAGPPPPSPLLALGMPALLGPSKGFWTELFLKHGERKGRAKRKKEKGEVGEEEEAIFYWKVDLECDRLQSFWWMLRLPQRISSPSGGQSTGKSSRWSEAGLFCPCFCLWPSPGSQLEARVSRLRGEWKKLL